MHGGKTATTAIANSSKKNNERKGPCQKLRGTLRNRLAWDRNPTSFRGKELMGGSVVFLRWQATGKVHGTGTL